MTRTTAVTICVVTGTDRRATRDFLGRIGRELGPHDNVALVGERPASLSESAAWRLVSARGGLRRPKDGERPRTRPVVVVVDDRIEAATGWIEILAAALADPTVGAVAPRCNSADGDELLVGVPYRPDEHGARRGFQRETMESARGRVSDVGRLAGPCIAARREVLEDLGGLDAALAGGFDPARLARQVSEAGRRLVVAESCYVHHPGGPTRRPDPGEHGQPLVTACLIVRDEQESLPRCLESMRGLADEIVVYDTGSTDATVQIASDAGAKVVRGYWDDDFGRARNEALADCRGQWILWLDADEAIDCDDTAGLRTKLVECPTDVESFILLIDNLVGSEAGSTFTHPACRLFRRAYGHWEGHIHEQVRARAGRPALAQELLSSARIAHRGYLQSAMSGRSKGDRNLRTAFSDLVDGPGLDWSTRLLSLGRSYGMAGLTEESLDLCRDAASQTTSPLELRLARRSIVDALLGLGRTSEALVEIDALRSSLTNQTLADIFEGQARLARKEHEQAVAVFDRVGSSIDEDGFEYSPSMVASAKAEALIELGRHGEAADTLLRSIRESNGVDAHLGRLIECLETSGRDLGQIYEALGTGRIETFVPQLLQLEPGAADRTLESWYHFDAASRPILAAAAHVAPKLGIERQLVWSSRLRSVGLANACPLLRSATDSAAPARYRALSAAACHTVYGDPRALHAFAAALLATPAPDLGQLRAEIATIAPALSGYLDDLEPAVAATTPPATSQSPDAAGVRVLVLDRQCSSLRSISLAGLFATTGYDVTIAQPLPVHPSGDLLGRIDAAVRGWSDAPPSDGTWLTRCTTALATITAEQRYDVVVVAASAVGAVPALRRLVPAAQIAVDLDDATTVPPGADAADLLLSSIGAVAGSGAPVAYAPTVVGRLLPDQPRLSRAQRSGLCVVANLRQLPSDAAAALRATLGPLLEKAERESSVTFCGDDPAHHVRDMLPGALVCDPMANPAPDLGAARAVLVCQPAGAKDWVDVARSCGTPVVVLPADASADGEAIDLVMRLLGDDGAWTRWAATRATAPTTGGDRPSTDPLAPLTAAARVRGRRTSTASPRRVVVATPSLAVPPSTAARGSTGLRRASDVFAPLFEGSDVASAGRVVTDEPWPPRRTSASGAAVVTAVAWPFGGLPAEWIAPLRDVVTELWVPTAADRATALRSGVDAESVRVVRPGVDTSLFTPAGAPYPLATTKATRLLFVGPWTEDGGLDIVLEGFLGAFTHQDDVCLVVAPLPAGVATHGVSLERDCRRAATAGRSGIEILEEPLDDHAMAMLYRSCTALVHTSRSTTLGRPVLEAIASGVPVVAARRAGLASLLDDSQSWLLSTREVPLVPKTWTPSRAGSWWLEARRTELRAALTEIVSNPREAARRGAMARHAALEHADLADAQETLTQALEELRHSPTTREHAHAPQFPVGAVST